ncbi:VOC family protein [Streptomyces sp. DT171]|uniref:VOC family protein n=1 Tax=Streptomyces sp. DT171 TaxID=3416524 RepID=UPI003CEB767D
MIGWTFAFIDRPAPAVARATAFWSTVTGTHPSAPWGERGEFTTLEPEAADACLATQAVGGPSGAHMDFAVEDPSAFTTRATTLGAAVVAGRPGLTVLRSPGGMPFCVVAWRGQRRRPPVFGGPGDGVARPDQVCVDVAPGAFDAEVGFWAALTGWESCPGAGDGFHSLAPPAQLPVRLLVQRLDEDRPASGHLDLACSDPAAVRAWHEERGASFVADEEHWIVMRDPAGGVYCLTGRAPEPDGPRSV